MGQGKSAPWYLSGKGMVVAVVCVIALSGQACVAHHHLSIFWNSELEQMGRAGALVDPQAAGGVVGDARGVGSSGFALRGQAGN